MDANADGGRKDLETREFTLDKALMVYNGGKPLDVFLVRAGVLPADALIRENRATGVLLVTSTPEELRHLQGFLDALPMPPAEVVLDVIVYKTAPGTAKNLNALASSHASVVLGRPFYDWTTNMETIARSLATSAVDEAGRPAARRTRDLTQTYMESETVVFKYRVKCRTDGAWNGGRTGGGERLEVALRLMPESLPPIADGMSTVLLSLDGQIKNYFDKKEAWSHDDLTCFLRVPVGGTSIIPFCMHGSFSKILSAYAVQITVVSLDPEKPAGSPPALRRR
jgi:hypothetical protein